MSVADVIQQLGQIEALCQKLYLTQVGSRPPTPWPDLKPGSFPGPGPSSSIARHPDCDCLGKECSTRVHLGPAVAVPLVAHATLVVELRMRDADDTLAGTPMLLDATMGLDSCTKMLLAHCCRMERRGFRRSKPCKFSASQLTMSATARSQSSPECIDSSAHSSLVLRLELAGHLGQLHIGIRPNICVLEPSQGRHRAHNQASYTLPNRLYHTVPIHSCKG